MGSISRTPDSALRTAGASRFSSSWVNVDVNSICTHDVVSNLRSLWMYERFHVKIRACLLNG